jgi:PAS domain S-box-containing protein
LQQQKQFSEDIVNSLPGIFYMLDAGGRIIRVNPQFLAVTGYSRDEVGHMVALDFFEGEDRNMIAWKMREVFEQGDASAEAELIVKSRRRIPYYFTGHRTVIDGQPYLVGIGAPTSPSAMPCSRSWCARPGPMRLPGCPIAAISSSRRNWNWHGQSAMATRCRC